MRTLYNTLYDLGQELYPATLALLASKGIKPESSVYKSIEVQVQPTFIQLLANEYLEYLSTGRRAGAKKIPISVILDFLKKGRTQSLSVAQSSIAPAAKFLKKSGKPMTDNQLAFAIQTIIYRRGIRGKNFWDIMVKMYEDMGVNKITTDVAKTMENSLDNLKIN